MAMQKGDEHPAYAPYWRTVHFTFWQSEFYLQLLTVRQSHGRLYGEADWLRHVCGTSCTVNRKWRRFAIGAIHSQNCSLIT